MQNNGQSSAGTKSKREDKGGKNDIFDILFLQKGRLSLPPLLALCLLLEMLLKVGLLVGLSLVGLSSVGWLHG